MSIDSEQRLDRSQAPDSPEQGLLLVRAPSDREIYGAFRALAAHWREQSMGEQLVIEGNVPLTPGLASPGVPTSLQRLLDADCEMIEMLAIEVRDIVVTYLRSGGHAPFRESFFDELRIQVREGATASTEELQAIFGALFSHLGVVSHSATSPFAEIIADVIAKDRSGDGRAQVEAISSPSRLA